jgi:hypothetical protein
MGKKEKNRPARAPRSTEKLPSHVLELQPYMATGSTVVPLRRCRPGRAGHHLDRPIELLIEDSANDFGTLVEKTLKFINVDHVEFNPGRLKHGHRLWNVIYHERKEEIAYSPGGTRRRG